VIALTSRLSEYLLAELKKLFSPLDIEICIYRNENSLIESVISNSSMSHFVIIGDRVNGKVQNLVDRMYRLPNIQSIYVYCQTKQLKHLRRLARTYPRLDAVFDDSLRLLIKLTLDMALFCEETAARQKDDATTTEIGEENYQRSITLYRLAEQMLI
jgi:hypothetical protein